MAKDNGPSFETFEMNFGAVEYHIIGATPLIFHAMSQKAQRELLKPRGRLSTADKVANEKHNPLREYQDSVYRSRGDDAPTRLIFPSTGVKAALGTAALEVPGATKSSIGRLVWVEGQYIDIYGIPELHMDVVRMADINRTPDIRTRAILPMWAATVRVGYAQPKISATAMTNLMHAAGRLIGIGDKRQGKGVGNHGTWQLCRADDPTFLAIKEHGGRAAQDEALEDPALHDENTTELFNWWNSEMMKKDPNLQVVSEAA